MRSGVLSTLTGRRTDCRYPAVGMLTRTALLGVARVTGVDVVIALTDHDSWDDPKYLKPADCDELGYCVHCGTATVHFPGCIVLKAV